MGRPYFPARQPVVGAFACNLLKSAVEPCPDNATVHRGRINHDRTKQFLTSSKGVGCRIECLAGWLAGGGGGGGVGEAWGLHGDRIGQISYRYGGTLVSKQLRINFHATATTFPPCRQLTTMSDLAPRRAAPARPCVIPPVKDQNRSLRFRVDDYFVRFF